MNIHEEMDSFSESLLWFNSSIDVIPFLFSIWMSLYLGGDELIFMIDHRIESAISNRFGHDELFVGLCGEIQFLLDICQRDPRIGLINPS